MKRIRWEDRGDGYWFAKVADGITAWLKLDEEVTGND